MKSIIKFEIFSIIFIFILGIILHFTYTLSNNNPLIGIFSSVNESTWEHLKLLFYPYIIIIIIGTIYFKDSYPNYLCIKTKGLIISLLFIIIFYYTYTGILGHDITFLNISSFLIAIIIEEYHTYKQINTNKSCPKIIPITILLSLFIIFLIFTFNPPKINIFKDPQTKTYGISKTIQ